MKPFSFADAYGLGLIARNPSYDWTEIVNHLGEDARKIADEIITPGGPAPREVKSAAQDLLTLAERVRNSPQVSDRTNLSSNLPGRSNSSSI